LFFVGSFTWVGLRKGAMVFLILSFPIFNGLSPLTVTERSDVFCLSGLVLVLSGGNWILEMRINFARIMLKTVHQYSEV
jgi:hypothetical protein